MFRIEKSFTFEAAHKLPHHDGQCANLHGHSFKGTLILEDYDLITTGSKTGMMIDYSDLKRLHITPLLAMIDHSYLNDSMDLESPTSELIAKWIYDFLYDGLASLVAVRIEETCTSAAEYWQSRRAK